MRDIKEEQIDKVKQILNDEIAALHRRQRDSKKRRKREAHLHERAAYKIKAIKALDANGLPVLIFILLCSTPEALGLVDASCGGTHLKGFEYDRCDSTIAIDYIIDTLIDMGILQLVDKNDNTRCDANNSRKCEITKKDLEEMLRWSCPCYTEDEAKCTARFIEVYIEACNRLNVPTIVIEAGGVTKGSNRVVKELERSNVEIDLLIANLWHIQFFSRKSDEMQAQVEVISNGVAALSTLLGKDQSQSFGEKFWSRHTGGVDNRLDGADMRLATALYHEYAEANELNREQRLDAIKQEFDESAMKFVRYNVDKSDAMTRYRELEKNGLDKKRYWM